MTIKELLHRIHALIEEYFESNKLLSTYLKEENATLKSEIVKLKDMIGTYEDACNDACDALTEVMEGRI